MTRDELQHQIEDGVAFWGYEENGILAGVMGSQPVQDVTLIRHAYVRTSRQKAGIGRQLLSHLMELSKTPILIGTWADATWAIRFYEKNGFQVVNAEKRDLLLRRYWKIPERQIETSVVLADSVGANETLRTERGIESDLDVDAAMTTASGVVTTGVKMPRALLMGKPRASGAYAVQMLEPGNFRDHPEGTCEILNCPI